MRKNILSRHQSHCEQLIFREYLFRITSSLQTLVMVNVTRLLTDSDLHGHIEYVGKYANSKIKGLTRRQSATAHLLVKGLLALT